MDDRIYLKFKKLAAKAGTVDEQRIIYVHCAEHIYQVLTDAGLACWDEEKEWWKPVESAGLQTIICEEQKCCSLLKSEIEFVKYDWPFWARKNQLPPAGDWSRWVILAGRGFGKSRAGAEWVKREVEAGRAGRIAIVGATEADTRDVMIEGLSGILAISSPDNYPKYEPSIKRLTWQNGAMAHCFSADEPERLRGPQHDLAWGDELCAWRFEAAYTMLQFGLRIGKNPRQLLTTTPKPTTQLKKMLKDPHTVVSRGSSYENRENLAPTFFQQIVDQYAGT